MAADHIIIGSGINALVAGAMLGLNMASSSVARIFGPMVAGALFSGLGRDWPFLVGALLTIPAAVMAINAGRAIRRAQAAAKPLN